MAATETERHDLREDLRDVLPEGAVRTLMDSLPPMDWHELATKTDLAALEERMDVRFDGLRVEVDAKFTEVAAGFTAVGAAFTEVDAKFKAVEARITAVGAETKRDVAKQTYVILAGAVAIAAPFYVALFMALFSGASG